MVRPAGDVGQVDLLEPAAALVPGLVPGAIDEHPAYEHYLAARILADTRETVRAVLAERLAEANSK